MRRRCGHSYHCGCLQPLEPLADPALERITADVEARLRAQELPEVRAAVNASEDELRAGIEYLATNFAERFGEASACRVLEQLAQRYRTFL